MSDDVDSLKDEKARYNVQMPKELRDDAKRNAERGELAEEVRALFRRKAYGVDETGQHTELQEVKAELREVRQQIDELRHDRSIIDSKIQTKEARATRLEERVEALEVENEELDTKLQMLENMLSEGTRLWPTYIKNTADVDIGTANHLYEELQERNGELPDEAFEEPGVTESSNWKDQQ